LIKQMETNSGVTFLNAQVALAREWIGPDMLPKEDVSVILPQETKEAIVVEGSSKTAKVPVPQLEEQARQVIAQFERGAPRVDVDVSDSVSSHRLQDVTSLLNEKWLGTDQEELNS
jgi:phospholipase D1/2